MYLVGFWVGPISRYWRRSSAFFCGLSMVVSEDFLWFSWELWTMPKQEGGLGLIDVVTQGHILALYGRKRIFSLQGNRQLFHKFCKPLAFVKYLVGFWVGSISRYWEGTWVFSCGLSMVVSEGFLWFSWELCTMPKEEGGLGLLDVATQGRILAAKWIVRCLGGSTPWQTLLQYWFQPA